MSAGTRDRLVGDWTLVTYIAEQPDGSHRKPYGEAVGRLSYDALGHMAGQVMRPDRGRSDSGAAAEDPTRAAYTGYIAYFGTYEVVNDGRTVIHHVEGALNPAWVGGQQVRHLRFGGPDRLVLHTDIERNGAAVRHVLTWQRLA